MRGTLTLTWSSWSLSTRERLRRPLKTSPRWFRQRSHPRLFPIATLSTSGGAEGTRAATRPSRSRWRAKTRREPEPVRSQELESWMKFSCSRGSRTARRDLRPTTTMILVRLSGMKRTRSSRCSTSDAAPCRGRRCSSRTRPVASSRRWVTGRSRCSSSGSRSYSSTAPVRPLGPRGGARGGTRTRPGAPTDALGGWRRSMPSVDSCGQSVIV